jgi:hypothetical protein
MKVLLFTSVGFILVLVLAVVMAFTRTLEDHDRALKVDGVKH